MNLISRTPRMQINLRKQQLLSLEKIEPQTAIDCLDGILWVTVSGDRNDHTLFPGERYVPISRNKVVIQALKDSNFEIEETPTYLSKLL